MSQSIQFAHIINVLQSSGYGRLYCLVCVSEYGRHLSELTVDVQCALPMRQLASVMLRQYVDTHWTPASDKFQPPEPSEATKTFIRQV